MSRRGETRGAAEAANPESGTDPASADNDLAAATSAGNPLAASTTSGIAWAGMSRLVIQAVQFGSTVVLARLLTPSDYGLVAIVTVFTGFAALFTDLGLGAAIIHTKVLDETTKSAAFWLNALSGFALTGLFCALAYPISLLYGQPKLFWLIIVGSFSFTLSMSTVHLAMLERSMRFRLIARIEISCIVISVAVTIGCAALGVGAFSLVIGGLTQTFVTTLSMWRAVNWLPRQFMRRRAVGKLWAYSSHLFGFNLVNYWSRNADNLLVGKYAGPAALGIYARAYNLMLLPVQQVTGVLGRVLFPALARLRDEPARLRQGYLRSLTLMTAVATPFSVLLAVGAPPFVDVVYGHRWRAVAPLLAILAASGPAQIIAGTLGPLYQAIGRTKAQFRRGLISSIITVVSIVIGLHWGVEGVAVALLIKFWTLLPYAALGCWPFIKLASTAVLKALWSVAFSALVMALAMWGCLYVFRDEPQVVQLLASFGVGLSVYFLCLVSVGRDVAGELRRVVMPRAGSRRGPRHRAPAV